MIFYGLKSEKKNCLMSWSASSNDGEFCNDVEISLSQYFTHDELWVTTNKKVAETVATVGPTAWYNSSYRSPNWDESYYGKLTVVCLNEEEAVD